VVNIESSDAYLQLLEYYSKHARKAFSKYLFIYFGEKARTGGQKAEGVIRYFKTCVLCKRF
jgi:hypothetical protein